MTRFRRLQLSTGVSLNVAVAGDQQKPAVILLHGFPESHRTWRDLAPRLEERLFLIMPDQRGFAGSDLPQDVSAYRTDILVEDVFALADAFGLEEFALVGHDWGGAIAWSAALREDSRLTRLAVINAPHPLLFQKSLVEDRDQRAASQYITAFRAPGFAELVETKGFDWFFETTFSRHSVIDRITDTEKRQYLADWSQPGAFNAMLNWYRASRLIVPPSGLAVPVPDLLLRTFPSTSIPVLVIWGMADQALLPVQLEGLDQVVQDLTVVRLDGVGHFAPWEAPDLIEAALEPFLAGQPAASAGTT